MMCWVSVRCDDMKCQILFPILLNRRCTEIEVSHTHSAVQDISIAIIVLKAVFELFLMFDCEVKYTRVGTVS